MSRPIEESLPILPHLKAALATYKSVSGALLAITGAVVSVLVFAGILNKTELPPWVALVAGSIGIPIAAMKLISSLFRPVLRMEFEDGPPCNAAKDGWLRIRVRNTGIVTAREVRLLILSTDIPGLVDSTVLPSPLHPKGGGYGDGKLDWIHPGQCWFWDVYAWKEEAPEKGSIATTEQGYHEHARVDLSKSGCCRMTLMLDAYRAPLSKPVTWQLSALEGRPTLTEIEC